jgi:hypothetical protein
MGHGPVPPAQPRRVPPRHAVVGVGPMSTPARLKLRPADSTRQAASLNNATPNLLHGLAVALCVYGDCGLDEMVITHGSDGVHGVTSLHPKGRAADLRTHDVRDAGRDPSLIVARLREALGRDWDVLLEDAGGVNEHIHLEFDPKPRKADGV